MESTLGTMVHFGIGTAAYSPDVDGEVLLVPWKSGGLLETERPEVVEGWSAEEPSGGEDLPICLGNSRLLYVDYGGGMKLGIC